MKRSALGFALAGALLACTRGAEAPPAQQAAAAAPVQEPAEPDFDSGSLLNVTRGAAVVSRTGEVSLDLSAVALIDGVYSTLWSSPPGGPEQVMVFSLAAPSRVTQIGVTTNLDPPQVPSKVIFEWSADGETWHPAGEIVPEAKMEGPQRVDVRPFTARYLRVSISEKSRYYASLRSVQAMGEEVGPPAPVALDGCWNVNGLPARFVQQGPHVAGVIASNPPTFFEGAATGRVAELVWMRGPMWGHAALTTSPDGSRFSGVVFHEEPSLQHFGQAQFGTRCSSGAATPAPGIDPMRFLDRTGRFPLFGLVFSPEGGLLAEPSAAALDTLAAILQRSSQRMRVVAHELREASPEQNRQRTTARIDAVRAALQARGVDLRRVEFVSAGSDWNGPTISVGLQRLMVSGIVVERVR